MAIERCQRAPKADDSKVNRQGKRRDPSYILPAHDVAPEDGVVFLNALASFFPVILASLPGGDNPQFGGLLLEGDIDQGRVKAYEATMADHLRDKLTALEGERKKTQRHVMLGDLPEDARFERLAANSKHFIDTIKMVACRAETAMAHTLREEMMRTDDAWALLCVHATESDILPNEAAGTLTVRLHRMASRSHDKVIAPLCEELGATKTVYPETNLRVIHEMASSHNPSG